MVLDLRGWTELLGTIPERAWVKDVRSRFVVVSEPFAEACGRRPVDLIGCDESVCFPTVRVARFRASDRLAVRRGAAVTIHELGPDGKHRTLKAPLYSSDGALVGTVGIAVAGGPRCESRIAELHSFVVHAPRRFGAPEWLMQTRAMLRRDFAQPVRLLPIASLVGRHPEHITRAFRHHFGVTPVEYVHRVRCARVAHACVSSDRPLSELALTVGFNDQSHLTRMFARYFGLPPAAYREALSIRDAP